MTAPAHHIRAMRPNEVTTLIDWAAAEGWNPGLGDAAAFRAADPDGFIGAFVGDAFVAGISATRYGDNFGFVGLYICRPDQRGRGFGKAVWDVGMAHLGGRIIGLDGVPQQQANYRAMGFVPAYRTIRYTGQARPAVSSIAIRVLESQHLQAIEAFDRHHFPAPRSAFLAHWLKPPHVTLIHIENDILGGFGVARPCRNGYKIGPLFARDETIAQSLFDSLTLKCTGNIQIDVPETAGNFIASLKKSGFAAGFETRRMYRGPVPAARLDGIFAITTLELG